MSAFYLVGRALLFFWASELIVFGIALVMHFWNEGKEGGSTKMIA